MRARRAWVSQARFVDQATVFISLSFDKGKPGESRGRKANGSNVTKVTMIARPPKTKMVLPFRTIPISQAIGVRRVIRALVEEELAWDIGPARTVSALSH